MKKEPTTNILIERQLAARTLAATILDASGHQTSAAELAALQDLVRWLASAFRIVHRKDPTASDLAVIVDTYAGERTLVGQAVRHAAGRDEKHEASHCNDWIKSCTDTSLDYVWLKGLLTKWCREHPDEARKALTPLTGEARASAAKAAGWTLEEDGPETGRADQAGRADPQ